MAGKNTKGSSSKKNEGKSMQEYRERQDRINKGAKIMAIVLIAAMVVFYVISAGLFLWD